MNKDELIGALNRMIPLELAERWDNSGVQVSLNKSEINTVLVALEVSNEVIEEAILNNVDMIITHHPLIFNKLSSIEYDDCTGFKLVKLVKNDIEVYSYHTNFDRADVGNNFFLANLIGLKEVSKCESDKEGYCVKGYLNESIKYRDLIMYLGKLLKTDYKKFSGTGDLNNEISKVCLCTGSGGEFLDVAITENCDLYITGDFKYHQAQKARECGICVLDCGHYASERHFIWNLSNILETTFKGLSVVQSSVNIDPFTF